MRRSILLVFYGLAVSCLLAVALACGDDNRIGPVIPETHFVRVSGDINSPVTVIPDTVRVKPLDIIKWFQTGMATADTFKIDLSAIVEISPALRIAVGNDTATVTIPLNTEAASYKYSVTLKFGPDSTFKDPRVIVEEG